MKAWPSALIAKMEIRCNRHNLMAVGMLEVLKRGQMWLPDFWFE